MSIVLAVVGSRDFKDYGILKSEIKKIRNLIGIKCIVTGCASGADSLAVCYSQENGIPCEKVEAEWKKYKRAAGVIRNSVIVERCDVLLAFWDGKSRGTKDTITKAKNAGKEIIIYEY